MKELIEEKTIDLRLMEAIEEFIDAKINKNNCSSLYSLAKNNSRVKVAKEELLNLISIISSK